MKKVKFNIFIKYLCSYMCLFLLPLVLLSFYTTHTIFLEMSELYEEQSKAEIQEIGMRVRESLDRFQTICSNIALDNEILPLVDLKDTIASMNTISSLKKYRISNSDMKEMMLYVEDDEYLYTSNSSYAIANLSKLPYFNEKMEKKIINDIFSHEEVYYFDKSIGFFREYSEDNIVSQVIKIKNKNVLLLFVLDETIFEHLPDSSSYFMVDQNENDIFKNTKKDRAYFEENPEYVQSVSKLENYNFTFYKYSNYNELFSEMNHLKKIYWLLLLVLFFLGAVMISYFMCANYRPIGKVYKKIVPTSGKGYSMVDIQDAVGNMVDENFKLKQSVKMKNFLHALLNGHITSKEEFLNTCEALRLEQLIGKLYYVAIFYFKDYDINNFEDNHSLPYTHMEMFQMVKKILEENADGYAVDIFTKGKIIFIGTCKEENTSAVAYSMLHIQECLKEIADNVNICLGNTYDSFLAIPQSYMDASLAVDYRFIKGNNSIIESKNLSINQDFAGMYPSKLFEKIEYYLKNGELDKLNEILNQFITYIKSENLPLYYVKGLCYKLISIISGVIEKINSGITIPKNKLSYACVLANYDTLEELVEAIHNIANNINMYLKEQEEKNENETVNAIKAYIDENAFDQNFSVQLLGEKFGMSGSAISSFIKNHTGTTILEYVTKVRMEKAEELLMTNKYTVNKITEMVGYVSASSFIRKFKQYFGFTPKEYIKQKEEKER